MSDEFDCIECGQHIVRIIAGPQPNLCAMCLVLPGWFRVPELRKAFAPEGLDNLPANERDQANDDT